MIKRVIVLVLVCLLILPTSFAAPADVKTAVDKTAGYVYKTVTKPVVDSIGGEWAVIGLARSEFALPDEYAEGYYNRVADYVSQRNGMLHEKKYTEHSRVILGLTALGYNPQNIGGYDLTMALADFESTIWQGINGPIFALIALDSADYQIPQNPDAKTQATRRMYVDEILSRQLENGGFALTSDVQADTAADPDITGMALQALAKYRDDPAVKTAIDKGLDCLSALQQQDGGYSHGSSTTLESTVQVLAALAVLGVDVDDPRFVKSGKSVFDNLMSYAKADGSFMHVSNGENSNQMSTEQALYGLVALWRAKSGKTGLYDMTDVAKRENNPTEQIGLPGKHADVSVMPVTAPDKVFEDVINHENKQAILDLASREIINGKSETKFDPEANMTRAEYAAIITRGLGLAMGGTGDFDDVSAESWYAGYIATAYKYGIVKGVLPTKFNPEGTITKQEAAVMTARAAALCGLDTQIHENAVRDMLAQFDDSAAVADWAKDALAFCYQENILSQQELEIAPDVLIKRAQIAQMLYNMLDRAKLV